jgi:hypothetical protein
MDRRIEEGPLAYAARSLDGEVLAALARPVPSRILLDGASIDLRPLPAAVAAPFAQACAAAQRQWSADGGWCAHGQRLIADLPPASPERDRLAGEWRRRGCQPIPASGRPAP